MAHTCAGDELAAERRRLPMTQTEPVIVVGPDGRLPLHKVFESRPVASVDTHQHNGQIEANCCAQTHLGDMNKMSKQSLKKAAKEFLTLVAEGKVSEAYERHVHAGFRHHSAAVHMFRFEGDRIVEL